MNCVGHKEMQFVAQKFVFTLHTRNTVNSCTRTLLKLFNMCKCIVLNTLYYTHSLQTTYVCYARYAVTPRGSLAKKKETHLGSRRRESKQRIYATLVQIFVPRQADWTTDWQIHRLLSWIRGTIVIQWQSVANQLLVLPSHDKSRWIIDKCIVGHYQQRLCRYSRVLWVINLIKNRLLYM